MIVGRNGCGKSTLFRVIAGLISPDAGTVHSTGKPALVFQNPDHQLLLPTCSSDLQLGMPATLSRHETEARVSRALADVGLAGFEERPIHTLSGGQKQRLAIAGALAGDGDLLLLDEPTALLDPEHQGDVLDVILGLCERGDHPITALWITHRLEELDRCHGAALMESGRLGPWRSGAALRSGLKRPGG
ncbi:ABC transporter ATP-binding protein [Synechococcus sp. RSCCF101]|nr:ABC transporter ATP-binding protein [Synechococcus sp. RSCCF101]